MSRRHSTNSGRSMCSSTTRGSRVGLGRCVDYPEEEFDRVFAVNVKGVFFGLQAVGRVMQEAGGGAIVNTASVAGLQASAQAAAYGATKSAVVSLTKSAAMALVGDGIRVNAICPGPIETRMMRAMERGVNPDDPEAVHTRLAASTPMGRYGEAEEIAAMVAFLASEDASYITGGIYPRRRRHSRALVGRRGVLMLRHGRQHGARRAGRWRA